MYEYFGNYAAMLVHDVAGMMYYELSKTVRASIQTEAHNNEESAPPAKRHCSSLFGHYKRQSITIGIKCLKTVV